MQVFLKVEVLGSGKHTHTHSILLLVARLPVLGVFRFTEPLSKFNFFLMSSPDFQTLPRCTEFTDDSSIKHTL